MLNCVNGCENGCENGEVWLLLEAIKENSAYLSPTKVWLFWKM